MSLAATLIGQLFKPATELIDNLHTSEEEKINAKTAMLEVQMGLGMKVLDYEAQLIEAESAIIVAEAQGKSWLQRTWRPITMLTFLFLVVADSFGQLPFRLAGEAWTLLQIGLGGYVAGRSGEKIVSTLKKGTT